MTRIHLLYVSQPSEGLGLKTTYMQQATEELQVKAVQVLFWACLCRPCFTAIQESAEDSGLVNMQLGVFYQVLFSGWL